VSHLSKGSPYEIEYRIAWYVHSFDILRIQRPLIQYRHGQREGHRGDDKDQEEAKHVTDKHLVGCDRHDSEKLEGHDEIEEI
jgi:hypothetical protein